MPKLPNENKLGLWTTTSLVAGNMIGAGVFLMPAALAAFGGISIVGWLFSSLGALCLAKVFSHLSKLLPGVTGGPYAYTRAGFGDFAGFIVAWGYWISTWTTNATLAVAFVSGLSTFFPVLKDNPVLDIVTGLSAIWLLTWVNTRPIRASGQTQLITTVLKLAPLLFVAIGGLFFMDFNNFKPFNISGTSNMQAITATAALTLFAFLGIECATIPAGNVATPEKTIPRATMLGTIITTLVYILVTITVMGMIPPAQLKNSATPLADAAAIIGGDKARYLVAAGVVLAAFGALNGWILIQGQIPYAIAKDRLFPAIFKKENRHGMPAAGVIISSVLVSACMYMNYSKALVSQFTFLSLLSTLTTLVPYLFCTSAYALINLSRGGMSRNKYIQTITLAVLSFAFSLWAVIGSGQEIVYWGFVLIMSGMPFYVWMVYKRDKENKEPI